MNDARQAVQRELVGSPKPVLVLAYNRPDHLRQLLTTLASAPVSKIYFWLDGPKTQDEADAEKCRQVRLLVDSFHASVPVERVYLDRNLGCKASVTQGITWFFSLEQMGMILEDDCLPSPDFFRFMNTLLTKYADDERFVSISGHVLDRNWTSLPDSYHFSRFPHIWGWGTWRRVWEKYDPDLNEWPALRRKNWLRKTMKFDRRAALYWWDKFNSISNNRVDTWDYQLAFLSFVESGLNVMPHRNMITNTGFGPEALHTTGSNPPWLVSEISTLGTLNHPEKIEVCQPCDSMLLQSVYRVSRPWHEILQVALKRATLKFSSSKSRWAKFPRFP